MDGQFDLDGKRGFTDYTSVVSSGGWRSGFRGSGESQGVGSGRAVDLGHNAWCYTSFLSVKKKVVCVNI
ncbi:hypothetical protein Hanom_Chr15g01376041 [Helianthus anomalus]